VGVFALAVVAAGMASYRRCVLEFETLIAAAATDTDAVRRS
jgi:hypothetical protein